MRPDFILHKPPEAFTEIGITPDRIMLRYQANEALRRETIAMLRKKRQAVAQEAAEKEAEQAVIDHGKEAAKSSKAVSKRGSKEGSKAGSSPRLDPMSPSLSPSPDFDGDRDGYMSEASSATTRSVHTEVELTHNEQVLSDQRDRLNSILTKSLKNVASRVQHTKDGQWEQDELEGFVNKKMERMNALATTKIREQEERMRIAGEREREKLLRLIVMEEEESARAAHDKEMRIKKMHESEAKREQATKARRERIAAENAERRAEAQARKVKLLADCEAKEEDIKRQMVQKQAEHEVRLAEFEEERARQLEALRLQKELKMVEAEGRVAYIQQNKTFQAQNSQARRLSEVAGRQFRKEVEKREWKKKKREDAIAKQEKAEWAREKCKRKQERKEARIQRSIAKKSLVSGRMETKRKEELNMKLEEAHILDAAKREKLHRLVSRRDYNDAQYLVAANKRFEKIEEAHRFKDVLMKERRGILYTVAQAELEARDDLKLIKLRLPTKSEKEEARLEAEKSKKRSTSSMF